MKAFCCFAGVMCYHVYQITDTGETMQIRTATMEDLDRITALEAACFPAAEAAPRASFEKRLEYFPNHFWLFTDGDAVVSMVNGMATDQTHLTDDLFADADKHRENGAWQMIFGVATLPEYRERGCAGQLLERAAADAEAAGRKGLVLTCKERLIPYYSKFGYVNEGLSVSTHGNAVWYEMRRLCRIKQ
jgi:ribosomal protein S18 acetylase RimI-like enzyme